MYYVFVSFHSLLASSVFGMSAILSSMAASTQSNVGRFPTASLSFSSSTRLGLPYTSFHATPVINPESFASSDVFVGTSSFVATSGLSYTSFHATLVRNPESLTRSDVFAGISGLSLTWLQLTDVR